MKFELNKNLFFFENKGYVVISYDLITYNPNGGTGGHFLCLHELRYGFDESYVKNVGNCEGCHPILATSFKLEGIPHFELPVNSYSESDLKKAFEAGLDYNSDILTSSYLNKPSTSEEYIKSINQIVSIELEDEIIPDENNYGTGAIFHNNRKQVLKIENEQVRIKSVGKKLF